MPSAPEDWEVEAPEDWESEGDAERPDRGGGEDYSSGLNADLMRTYQEVDDDLARWTQAMDQVQQDLLDANDAWAAAMEAHQRAYPAAYVNALDQAGGKVTTAKQIADLELVELVVELRRAEALRNLTLELSKNRRAQVSGAQTRARTWETQVKFDQSSR